MMGVTFEVDHVIPRSAGGRSQFDNLCVSCPTCNRHKASRLSGRDPLSGRMVTLFSANDGAAIVQGFPVQEAPCGSETNGA